MATYIGPPADLLSSPPALQPRTLDPRFLGPPVAPFPLPRIGRGYPRKPGVRIPRRRRRAAMITLAQYGHHNP